MAAIMALVRVLLLLLAISAVLSAPNPLNRVKRDESQDAVTETEKRDESQGYTGFANYQPETRAEGESRFPSNIRQNVGLRPAGSYPTNTGGYTGPQDPGTLAGQNGQGSLRTQQVQDNSETAGGAQVDIPSSKLNETAKSPSPTPSPAQPAVNHITQGTASTVKQPAVAQEINTSGQVSSSTFSSTAKTTTIPAENPAPAGSSNQTAQAVTPTVRLDGVASETNKSTPAPALKSTTTPAQPKEEPNKASSVPSTVKSTLSTSTSNQPTLAQAAASSTVKLAPPTQEQAKQPTQGAPSPSSTKSTTIPVQPVATQAKTEDHDSTGGNGNPQLPADEDDQKKDAERKTGDDVEEEESSSSHFMAYFITACVLCVIGYLGFHNKQKILAYIIEGRKNQRRRAKNGGASYKRLDNTVEESMDINNRTKDYIY